MTQISNLFRNSKILVRSAYGFYIHFDMKVLRAGQIFRVNCGGFKSIYNKVRIWRAFSLA